MGLVIVVETDQKTTKFALPSLPFGMRIKSTEKVCRVFL